ncbi:MAG: BRO family protein [Coprococcus sp.]|nr:BRO family protein [Coprococcus sp.]
MNNLEIFKNAEFGEIRTAVVDDEPMFCLIDICKALEMSNPTIVAQRLDDDERTKLDLGRLGKTNFRTVIKNGEPWFVGRDVAESLGYSNASKAVMDHVSEEDKMTETSAYSQNGNTVGKLTFINESGLYSLILSSKLSSTGSLL